MRLVVVPTDHWLMETLCQAKRLELATALQKERGKVRLASSWEELTMEHLHALLSSLKQGHVSNTTEDAMALSERVSLLASAFSERLPEHEPLLVEMALVRCLREWGLSHKDESLSEKDAVQFEALLTAELRGEAAQAWFDCQFIINSIDVLKLSRLFYQERITNPVLKKAISISLMRSQGDVHAFAKTMIVCLTMEEFAEAAEEWDAWFEKEFVAIGRSNEGDASSQNRSKDLSDLVANASLLDPHRYSYFPLRVDLDRVGGQSFRDLSGSFGRATSDDDAMHPGYFYRFQEDE